jgi:CubicO group peptidase (beta-lactamase class C family)
MTADTRMVTVALLLAAAISACTAGGEHTVARPSTASSNAYHVAGDELCNETKCISVPLLRESVIRSLTGNVVGGIVLIGNTEPYTTGYARRSGDHPVLAMTEHVPMNTGSIGKIFTTIAVLQWLGRNELSVETPIAPYLPKGWAQGPNVHTITFEKLLTHRAGFRLPTTRVFETRAAAREQIAAGVNQVDQRIAQYNNIDFTIFEDLAPQMEGLSAPPADRGTASDTAADRWYEEWIQHNVFDRVGVHDATCNAGPTTVLAYAPLSEGTAHGSQIAKAPSGCSAGGWMMTAASIRQVLQGLGSNTLLSNTQRQAMDEDCLGWDCSTLEQATYRGKDGFAGNASGTAALVAFAGIIAGVLPVVLAANSPPPDTWFQIVSRAITDATSPNTGTQVTHHPATSRPSR